MSLEIIYIGEHLWPGRLGHGLLLLATVALLYGIWSYSASARSTADDVKSASWYRAGRHAWFVHSISLWSAIGLIFYLMGNRWYEYAYVFEHVNDMLDMRYILSAFWEGQEGSFLLWMFWHAVLGAVITSKRHSWSGPVMAVLCGIQLILISMLLGIHVPGTDFKIGSSPFMLLREVMDIPVFQRADYLTMIEGRGLNALLQNYWMTIHPPTLFLGFASMSIPFCFAVAGLWTGKHREWLTPALKWSLFGAGILGIGIVMGAAWAYEALSFGGYWSWDPVENTSFVPWLLLVAGVHVNLISKATGQSIRATYLFYILVFVATVYSTLLTRSGVLGDTSAHAFTQMGLEAQLLFFLFAALVPPMVLYAYRARSIPRPEVEEKASSREFWMFLGALVLLMSAVLMSFTTSIPVYNKVAELFGYYPDWAMPVDREAHHNRFQVWIAICLGIGSGIAQYLRWRGTNWSGQQRKFWIRLAVATLLTVILTAAADSIMKLGYWVYVLAFGAGVFTIICSLDILISGWRKDKKVIASVMSHVGFGVLLMGILLSGVNKYTISKNAFAQKSYLAEEDARKSVVLLKGLPMYMSGLWATYKSDTLVGNKRTFHLQYEKRDEQGNAIEVNDLYPYLLYTNDFSELASTNPYTLRRWNKDIFTTITRLPETMLGRAKARAAEDSIAYEPYLIGVGDTIKLKEYALTIGAPKRNVYLDQKIQRQQDKSVGLEIAIVDSLGREVNRATSGILLRDEYVYDYPAQFQKEKIRAKLTQRSLQDAFPSGSELSYDTISVKRGEEGRWRGQTVTILELHSDTSRMSTTVREGDIAVQAVLQIGSSVVRPSFIVRDGRVLSEKELCDEDQLYARFLQIEPTTDEMQFAIARAPVMDEVELLLTEDAARTDLVVIETTVFPGINLVWLGCVLMMLGLLIAMILRYGKK